MELLTERRKKGSLSILADKYRNIHGFEYPMQRALLISISPVNKMTKVPFVLMKNLIAWVMTRKMAVDPALLVLATALEFKNQGTSRITEMMMGIRRDEMKMLMHEQLT